MQNYELQYRSQTNLVVAVASLVFLSPFSINNFLQGRIMLGVGSGAIVALLGYNAWSIRIKKRIPWTTAHVLAPAIILFLLMAFFKQGIVGAFWTYPSVIAFCFMLPERQSRVINSILVSVVSMVSLTVLPLPLALRVLVTLLAVTIFSMLSIRVINRQQQNLERIAVTDSLTGLYNRTLLDSTLERAVEHARRSNLPTSLLLLDLDHFKSINDSFGHDVGDKALQAFSDILTSRLRRSDYVFRIGGEEFLILLYQSDANAARRVAEEIRETVVSTALIPHRRVTTSIGVASLNGGECWTDWLKRADQNLYAAKERGRNRVVTGLRALSSIGIISA